MRLSRDTAPALWGYSSRHRTRRSSPCAESASALISNRVGRPRRCSFVSADGHCRQGVLEAYEERHTRIGLPCSLQPLSAAKPDRDRRRRRGAARSALQHIRQLVGHRRNSIELLSSPVHSRPPKSRRRWPWRWLPACRGLSKQARSNAARAAAKHWDSDGNFFERRPAGRCRSHVFQVRALCRHGLRFATHWPEIYAPGPDNGYLPAKSSIYFEYAQIAARIIAT